MLSKEQAQKLIEKALSYSTFPDCSVGVSSDESAFVRYALNGITTSGFVVEQTMSISSSKDGKSGSQQVAEFTDAAIEAAVKESERVALLSDLLGEEGPVGRRRLECRALRIREGRRR